MEWSGDKLCSYIVLRPDLVYYFYHQFSKYPVTEVEIGTPPTAYLKNMAESPNDNPAEGIGVNWYECVMCPPSARWFVHALRSSRDDGGHLQVPIPWLDRVTAFYPYMTVSEAV
jgi:hypothetical protein